MGLRERLKRIEAAAPVAVQVWLTDPADPGWSNCPATGERISSAALERAGVLHVTMDIGADRWNPSST